MKRRQEAQAVYGEVVATTNKELKEMHEEIEKLDDKVNAIREKSENTTFTEAAREKYRKEAEEKEEASKSTKEEYGNPELMRLFKEYAEQQVVLV